MHLKAKRTIYTALGGCSAAWYLLQLFTANAAAEDYSNWISIENNVLLCAAVLLLRSAWRIDTQLKKRSRDHIGHYF